MCYPQSNPLRPWDQTPHKHGVTTQVKDRRSATSGKYAWFITRAKPTEDHQQSTSHRQNHSSRVKTTLVNGTSPNDAYRHITPDNISATRTNDNTSKTSAHFSILRRAPQVPIDAKLFILRFVCKDHLQQCRHREIISLVIPQECRRYHSPAMRTSNGVSTGCKGRSTKRLSCP